MSVFGGVTQKLRRFERSSLGGAAVELAVVFPVLVLLFIGAVDYGRLFYTSITVANAARAGAEWGAKDTFDSDNSTEINKFAQADGQEAGTLTLNSRQFCECFGATASCTTSCSGGSAPEVFVEVIASKSVPMSLPYPGLPSAITVSRKATFRAQ